MSLAGNLETMHLGDLLQWCGTNLKTGTLRLRRGPIEKRLFFKEGRLFSSTSNSPRETLGQFLIRSGRITEEELFKALIEQDRVNEPLGQILIREGLLTDDELQRLLQLKTEESIYDCFLWPSGEFVFEENALPEKIPVSLPLDLTGVILEGARRSDEWQRIREAFPSRFTTFRLREDAVRAAGDLSEEDRKILDLVDRGKNLGEIALELHAVDFYAASRLLELHGRGLVDVDEAPEEIPFEEQVAELREKLRAGVVCYNAGEYTAALNAFEDALRIDPQNKYARLFLLKVRRLLEDSEAVADLPLDAVPQLRATLAEIERLELDPQEAFVLSRINGEWDLRSIVKVCPMGEPETLVIVKRLVDQKLVVLEPP